MSQEILTRGIFACLFSLIFMWGVFSRGEREMGGKESEGQKYLPYISGSLLPMLALAAMVFGTLFYGVTGAAKLTLSICFGIFLHICVYYLVLILLLPFFHRHISARACAMLWIIPNYLYIMTQSYMRLPKPMFVISAPGDLAWILVFLWFAGFCGVLLWKTVQHLIFRRYILDGAVPVTDPEILSVWKDTVEEARIKKADFRLVVSPRVNTPLSVGLFRRTTRVVLPDRHYGREELALVLKHEVIHIAREDAWSKYFLVFCSAMCWFNPLMWIAMKKSAEDMELSCDETVLLNADEQTRRKYAALLLDAAGDDRGFTTCLAASAGAMRYRLRCITKPGKRSSGALAVGITFFLLCMTSGYVTLAYGGGSGEDIIYRAGDPGDYKLTYISAGESEYNTTYDKVDEEAFRRYLGSLKLSEFTGNYSFSDSEKDFTYIMDTPEGPLVFRLWDNAIRLTYMGKDIEKYDYYIEEGVDWDYIGTVIVARPALNVLLTQEGAHFPTDLTAGLSRVWAVNGEERELTYQIHYPSDGRPGIHGDGIYLRHKEIEFDFSQELVAPCSVTITSWDWRIRETVTQEDMTRPFVIPMPQYPAHYTVNARLRDPNGNISDAQFQFDIGDL